MKATPAPSKRRILRARVLLLSLLLVAMLVRPAERHLRAASLLLRFANADAHGFVADYDRHALDETLTTVPTSSGEVRARIYAPRGASGVSRGPGVVIVHGVHRLGIEEPRMMRFARAIAATGITVLTPEVKEIADYRIDAASVETIGAAAKSLSGRLGGAPVGVMGMSFAGGLGLLAASDPRFASDVGFVVAIGAHDDLGRVLRFFATNQAERPDGTKQALAAHPYGALVLIYSHVERVVPAADVPAARDALRLWLWEQPDAARARAKDLSPEARARIEALFEGKGDVPALIDEVARDQATVAAVSPHGHLGALQAPVFLLHGAGDTVIPASETLWLAEEIPSRLLRAALVSPALVHVELQGEPSLAEQWALVHFMAGVLDTAG
jgi:dienelactone hydrolase